MYIYLKIPIYNSHLLFIINETDEHVKNYLTASGTHKPKKLMKRIKFSRITEAQFTPHRSADIIRLKRGPDDAYNKGVLCHEILHAVFHILRTIGMPHSNKSEEAYAYLNDYITIEFYKEYEKRLKLEKRLQNDKNSDTSASD